MTSTQIGHQNWPDNDGSRRGATAFACTMTTTNGGVWPRVELGPARLALFGLAPPTRAPRQAFDNEDHGLATSSKRERKKENWKGKRELLERERDEMRKLKQRCSFFRVVRRKN